MSTFLHSWILTCRAATTRILLLTAVMCTGPSTWPATITLSETSLIARPRKGEPLLPGVVGMDMSITQRWRLVRLPDAVAAEADAGRRTWRSFWFVMVTLFAAEKLGFLVDDALPEVDDSSAL